MNATNFFTRRILGLDYRVWGFMLLICLLSLGFCGFKQTRLQTLNDQPCATDTIALNGRKVEIVANCYVNRYVPFEVQAAAGAIVKWNFGDGTAVEKGQIVSHKFTEEGTYRVTASINGQCEIDAKIIVVDDPFVQGRIDNPVVEIFADPAHPKAGTAVKFYCVSDLPPISSYEWTIVNANESAQDSVPTFTFANAGNVAIQLVLNNDPLLTWTTVIHVIPEDIKPGTPNDGGPDRGMPDGTEKFGPLITEKSTPLKAVDAGSTSDTSGKAPIPKATQVDAAAFKDLLQNVIDQDGKELEDLNVYLDYKASTMVEVNESKTPVPLKDFCKEMRDKKKKQRKIESLSFKIDDKKSIQTIRVKVPRNRSFWERLNPFG